MPSRVTAVPESYSTPHLVHRAHHKYVEICSYLWKPFPNSGWKRRDAPPQTIFIEQRERAHRSSSDGQDSKSTCRISFRTAGASGRWCKFGCKLIAAEFASAEAGAVHDLQDPLLVFFREFRYTLATGPEMSNFGDKTWSTTTESRFGLGRCHPLSAVRSKGQ